MQERAEKTMEEKAVLRVRDRISAALTVPYEIGRASGRERV